MNRKKSQSGMAHLIIIIAAVVVVVIGGLGFAYWKSAQDKIISEQKQGSELTKDIINNINDKINDKIDEIPAMETTSVTPAAASTCVADKAAAMAPVNTQMTSLQAQIVTLTANMQQKIKSGAIGDVAGIQSEMATINTQITSLQAQIIELNTTYSC